MKITKLGHCCLVIEEKGLRIMTDPGSFTTAQNEQKNTRPTERYQSFGRVDIILITHEHFDHLHIDSLKKVLANNPNVKVITNAAVGKLLDAEGIAYELLEDKQQKTLSGVLLEGFGEKHGVIYEELGQVQNTGYFIADRFFYPGDALYDPGKKVEILALPVAGPWVKVSDAIEYAKLLKPRFAFPVHDALLAYKKPFLYPHEQKLPKFGITFETIADGESREY